jgi:formamidopyrimidine-DNA glycosylase
MPELPEVETIKNILANYVLQKTIRGVKVINRNTIDGDVSLFVNSLVGKTIIDLQRMGKFLVFHLNDEIILLSHLRMEGKYFYHQQAQENYDKHACVIFNFDDGSVLEYNDTRKFGIMKVDKRADYLRNPPLSKLGPEPFSVGDIDALFAKMKRKSIPIKMLLLDQSFLSGLGNIYVDEVLYLTKIHPETPASMINIEQLKAIIDSSVDVLKMAIASGGSTIRSYHPSQGIDGGFQTKLNAYGRQHLPCLRCSHEMRKIFVGGRGTTFCPNCQKNPALPYVLGITGPIGSGKSSATAFFKDHGYLTISGDAIVSHLYQDKNVQKEIIKLFGEEVITSTLDINKNLIIATIIADPNKKRRLEKLLHPRVEQAVLELIKKTNKDQRIAVEMPLLFESKIADYCDETLYVDIKKDVQKERLASRRLPVEISLALNAGFDAKHNKEKATYVVDNSSTLDALHIKLQKIIS